jgi:hypothetical protein
MHPVEADSPGEIFMDLTFLLLTVALFGLTLGLALLCARLMEKKS